MATQTVPASDQKTPQNAPVAKDRTKPAAMAIPKEGYFKTQWAVTVPPIRDRPQITASPSSRKSFPAESRSSATMGTKKIEDKRLPVCPTLSKHSSFTTYAGSS